MSAAHPGKPTIELLRIAVIMKYRKARAVSKRPTFATTRTRGQKTKREKKNVIVIQQSTSSSQLFYAMDRIYRALFAAHLNHHKKGIYTYAISRGSMTECGTQTQNLVSNKL